MVQQLINIVEDDQGILRAEGRMKNACLSFDTKSPIILFKDYICQLIVEYCHQKVYHNGEKQTIAEFCSRYYISRTRQFIKKCLRLCIVCKKINCRTIQYPSHSTLPQLRYDDKEPFNSIGLDYLGPLSVLPVFPPKEKMNKIHVVLYTCAATRGILLDVVEDLSASSFISSLRQIIAE